MATVAYWRDLTSLKRVRVGDLVPDIAFGCDLRDGEPWENRRTVVVSLRGDRALPDEGWFDSVQRWAKSNAFDIVTVAQVEEDEDRASWIAERLDARHFAWESSPAVHEERVRELYGSARLAVSDRLHVLILAALGGAIPAELVPRPNGKVATHFSVIGFPNVSQDSEGLSSEQVDRFLSGQLMRREEVAARIRAANQQVAEALTFVHAKVEAAVSSRSSRPIGSTGSCDT
ncbi:hypothetical protein [Microbacterium sediminicola]|uniref:hypothetical protein n=1 Tax=Microbacterium sediminicola TaxID=415210 RepID=UPI0031E32B8D